MNAVPSSWQFWKGWRERWRKHRERERITVKIVEAIGPQIADHKRVGVALDAFQDEDHVREVIATMTYALKAPIRAHVSDGLLFFYPDVDDDGLDIVMAEVKREAPT